MTVSYPLILFLVLVVVALGSQENLVPESRSPSSSSSSSSASRTSEREKQRLVKGLEANLLSMFGLKTRPRPSRDVLIPGYMLELYQKHLQGRGALSPHRHGSMPHLTLPANTIRSFLTEDSRSSRRRDHRRTEEEKEDEDERSHREHFYFNVSTMPGEEILSGAEFRVYLTDVRADLPVRGSTKHRIEVYEVIKPATRSREAITRLLDTRHVHPHRSRGWESFDVRPAVLQWKVSPSRNHGLEVHVTGARGEAPSPVGLKHVRLKRSLGVEDPTWTSEQPFLVTYSDDGRGPKPKRRKRSNKRHKKRSRSQRRQRRDECSRHNLYVDFSEVGWEDWIVAPPGYQAYHCYGECNFPYPDYTNTTNHAIVQTLVNAVNPKAVPKPCCVPTELSPISMLYLDEYDKVVLKNYQDMVVQRCGCL